ncbi:MAG TPA: winged helix-turn-helix domain-containing protein [Nitrososphaerales archaeon]|nr:winged helix-turn-helix domain-containing protein [Nitrososphaerales archaeon]
MAQYRTHLRIIVDVLASVQELNLEGEGVGLTALLRKGNMPYQRVSTLVGNLVETGLLIEHKGEKSQRYEISRKGEEFLRACRSFEDFAHAFGLNL